MLRLALLACAALPLAAADWIQLFDGKSFANWTDPTKLSPPGDSWTIDSGAIKSVSHPKLREDLVSKDKFRDFELEWEWKISVKGNSGLKYRIQELVALTGSNRPPDMKRFEDWPQWVLKNHLSDRSKMKPGNDSQVYVVGFEFQMIDDGGHADARRGGLYQAGSLYSMVGPAKPAAKPVGEWNRSRVVLKGNHVEHWLNGEKVVDAMLDAPVIGETLAKRWGKTSEVYRLLVEQPRKETPISLQNHNDEAWFRNIRIRRL